jgi:DMSO/TMAO reductase YedYZ molybdopterin-dependent catalytic subunit
MDTAPPRVAERRVLRWNLTERSLHWVHAAAFCILLGSGLCLYLPSLSEAVSRRPLLKEIHLYTAASWAGAVVLVVALGNLFPVGGWRIYTISGSMPIFDRAAWKLEVGGLVARPRSFTYDELLSFPRAHQVSDFHCVTGWTVRGVRWSGVRFSHLLDQVEPLPEATAIRFVSLEEPYDDSLTLDQIRLRDVMLALEMDGQPLSRPHGSPARVVIPEMYGYKGVKWLTRMELVAEQPTGYWEERGYDQNAWVGRSNGR